MREDLPFSEKVLQTLHNICATSADLAKPGDEIANIMERDQYEIESILDNFKVEGFTENFIDNEGKKKYYLNARGIVKVCSLFT